MRIGMIYRNTFILVLAFLVSACSSNAKKAKQQSELYFGAGTQSLMSQDFTDALQNLVKANELDLANCTKLALNANDAVVASAANELLYACEYVSGNVID